PRTGEVLLAHDERGMGVEAAQVVRDHRDVPTTKREQRLAVQQARPDDALPQELLEADAFDALQRVRVILRGPRPDAAGGWAGDDQTRADGVIVLRVPEDAPRRGLQEVLAGGELHLVHPPARIHHHLDAAVYG